MEVKQMKHLSTNEAYQAMILFLDHYWRLGGKNSDELAGLLGSLAILPDGSSADPALMEDWEKCVNEVLTRLK
jgi:hypothetical protein